MGYLLLLIKKISVINRIIENFIRIFMMQKNLKFDRKSFFIFTFIF